MEVVLRWQMHGGDVRTVAKKMARVREFFGVSRHGGEWFAASHRLKYLRAAFVLSLFVGEISPRPEGISVRPPPLIGSGAVKPCVRI